MAIEALNRMDVDVPSHTASVQARGIVINVSDLASSTIAKLKELTDE